MSRSAVEMEATTTKLYLETPPLTFVPLLRRGCRKLVARLCKQRRVARSRHACGLGPKDRNFITKTDDADASTLVFGNGIEGSRIPTGVLNVNSTYRRASANPVTSKLTRLACCKPSHLA
jgi:hypothetical protein